LQQRSCWWAALKPRLNTNNGGKYLNDRDISDITNVVLQGVSNSSDPAIFNIGWNIYNEISKNRQYQFTMPPQGLDNFTGGAIAVPPIDQSQSSE
jgi:hypothetical protein